MNSTSLEQTVQQLKPSTSYEFRVVAWNSHGPSQQAAAAELTTLPEGLCRRRDTAAGFGVGWDVFNGVTPNSPPPVQKTPYGPPARRLIRA